MRKILFACVVILYTAPSVADCAFGLLKTELPAGTETGPNKQYIQDEYSILKPNETDKIRYLQCGPNGATNDRFVYCSNNSQVLGGDGNIYQCKNNQWIKLEDSNFADCNFDDIMDRDSPQGSYLMANKYQLPYIFVPNYDQYHKILNNDICKVALNDYYTKEDDCMFQGGEFLFLGKVCDTSGAHPITVTVKNTDGEYLSGVSFTYPQMNLPENQNQNIATELDNTYTMTVGEYSNLTQIQISKADYTSQILTVKQIQDEKDNIITLDATGNNPVQTDPEITSNMSRQIAQTQKREDAQPIPQATNSINTDYENNNETDLDKKLTDAQNALKSAQDTENSLANRLLGGASTAATGLGGMMIAQGLAEQKADKDAEADMRAYLATFKCEYGNGQYANAGNEEITLPGGNELLEYYNEYKTLADNLKTTKTALGLRTGIESEVLYDRAQTGLYQYSTAERQSGGEISLARALSDGTGEDAARWAEQKEQTAKQLKTGAIVAGAGVVGGIAGNYLINGRNQKTEEIKQEFKKAEERIEKEYPQSIVSIPELESKTVSELKTILPSNITQSSSTLESIQTLSIKNFQSDESIFDPGEFTINNTHTDALDKYLAETENILSNPDNATVKVCISVIGHTDRTIPKPRQEYKDNKGLSELRANSVKMYVESKLNNVKDHIISIISKGKGDEECFEGYYARNDRNCRRVEINIMDCSRISPELL